MTRKLVSAGASQPPRRGTVPYFIAQYIRENGPQAEVAILAMFVSTASTMRLDLLQRSITNGWLRALPDGRIDCGDLAHEHLGGPSKAGYVGERAGPRIIDLMNRPRYVPPKRQVRSDAPDCSVRAIPSFYGSGK